MTIKKFKNGNFSIRIEEGEFENTWAFVVALCDSAEADFTLVGEDAFNTGGYYILYNCNTCKFYNVLDEPVKAGTMRLYGYKDEERREELEW